MSLLSYPYELPPLPYAYDALEPYVDAETMHYHHDKHFASYINNLNAALKPYPALQSMPLDALLTRPLPQAARTDILRNAGGVYNHKFFFEHLSPPDGNGPDPMLEARIEARWGSFQAFRDEFTKAALSVFGSGWACLAQRGGHLSIVTLANQETVLSPDLFRAAPIMLMDVWEHAYYLKYKNARADYIKALWNVVKFGE